MATAPDFLKNRPVHDALKPISWLIGRWMCESANGQFPSIAPFKYCEQIEFRSLGQPLLQYEATSWHPEGKNPMHLESGFMCIKPGTEELSFLVAHNFGLTTVEEGHILDGTVALKAVNIGRMSFSKDTRVIELHRNYQMKGDNLEMVVYMQTDKSPLSEHLKAIYKRVA